MLLNGGFNDSERYSDIHIYDFKTQKWRILGVETQTPMDRRYKKKFKKKNKKKKKKKI